MDVCTLILYLNTLRTRYRFSTVIYTPFSSFSTVLLGVYVCFLVLCTVCDLASRYYGVYLSNRLLFLSRLSLAKSSANILSLKTQDDDVAVIHGLRVISAAWIVLVHEYLAQFYAVNLNVFDIAEVSVSDGVQLFRIMRIIF